MTTRQDANNVTSKLDEARGPRALQEVIDECVARERTAMRNSRVADAALYREVRDRAEAVIRREGELEYARRTVAADEAARASLLVRERRVAMGIQHGLTAVLVLGAILVLSLLTGCSSHMPPIVGPVAGSVEIGAGVEKPSGRGGNDLGDVDPYPFLQIGGAFADGEKDETPKASGEWFVRYGTIDSMDVDAGDLGLFDLEADVVRMGLGLRLGTTRSLGLDWSLGLGACLTVVHGEASAGDLSKGVSESGLGAYATLTGARGPFYVGLSYIDGPEAEIEDETAQLGGLSAMGGFRWAF